MLDARKNVLPRGVLMTESLLKSLISAAVSSLQIKHDLNDKQLADALFVDPGTIANARNRDNKLQAQTLFNMLSIEPLALEGLLQHYNRRSVPITAKCEGDDELVPTTRAVASLAAVKSPDSQGGTRITDAECIGLEADIDAAIEALSALKVRCIEIRTARAA